MEFVFVHAKGGWWLKITSVEELLEYHKITDSSRYEEAIEMFLQGKRPDRLSFEERIKYADCAWYKQLQAAMIKAQQYEGTILDGFRLLNIEAGLTELRCLQEHQAVYINSVGGHTYSLNYTQFCRRKSIVFPHFQKSDIRLKRYPGGIHWYAFIGDVQLHNGEEVKWNTRQAALEVAEAIVEERL